MKMKRYRSSTSAISSSMLANRKGTVRDGKDDGGGFLMETVDRWRWREENEDITEKGGGDEDDDD
eukprot:CAMPEP_0172522568 /NCGR_PEP_ID=MMETSP1066-20121228/293198_1 /TAXON_ID=671091 /ORGANISM="Coscinodiscus wailesii, Strain CCMP2513" /LENGTH=64 /DNA_ID=CAMNT_0013305585 /DNA_START=1118 /DNA_END=1309 /DNA_ORIENTATION=+